MKPGLPVVMPMPDGYAEGLAEAFTVHYHPRIAADDPAPDKIGPGVRAVPTNGSIGAEAALLERLANVEIVSSFGAGHETIDVAAARRRDIAVTYGPGTEAHSVADMAVSYYGSRRKDDVAYACVGSLTSVAAQSAPSDRRARRSVAQTGVEPGGGSGRAEDQV